MGPILVSCPGSPESPVRVDHGTVRSSSPPPAGRRLAIAAGPGARTGSTCGQAGGGPAAASQSLSPAEYARPSHGGRSSGSRSSSSDGAGPGGTGSARGGSGSGLGGGLGGGWSGAYSLAFGGAGPRLPDPAPE